MHQLAHIFQGEAAPEGPPEGHRSREVQPRGAERQGVAPDVQAADLTELPQHDGIPKDPPALSLGATGLLERAAATRRARQRRTTPPDRPFGPRPCGDGALEELWDVGGRQGEVQVPNQA